MKSSFIKEANQKLERRKTILAEIDRFKSIDTNNAKIKGDIFCKKNNQFFGILFSDPSIVDSIIAKVIEKLSEELLIIETWLEIENISFSED